MNISPESETIEAAEVELEGDYPQYQGEEGICRKQLPDRQNVDGPSSEMSENMNQARNKERSTGKKRVMFQDQQVQDSGVKKDLFAQSEDEGGLGTSKGYTESEPQSLQKYPGPAPDYDHFHDESMSKLEAVLQRQRERLENMGGYSGKSSQISQGIENQGDLEEAYEDLEQEIQTIKRNLEASQNSENYSPMKLGAKHVDDSGMDEMSPSDLDPEY